MGERRITGIEDTVVAGPFSGTETRPPSTDSIRIPGALLIAARYQLLGLVGVGGMGSVYRARDTELDEVIALKVLRRELVDTPGMLDRFRREVKLARRVTHRNVARTFDIGEHHGERFLTMEFIEGESVADLLEREGMVPLMRAVEIVRDVCGGLGAAHAAGVLHRDLKPDNVLIAMDGRIAITDFGVARASFDAAASHQTQGLPVGTPAYMSPEQVEGHETDARTDIYAVGAILFELLTGEAAWDGSSPYTVAAMRLLEPPPDPRGRKRDIPQPVAELVMKCMAREREGRYANVDELSRALALLEPHIMQTIVPRGLIKRSSHPAPREAEKLVAVLPFENRGGSEDDYVADGLTEDLIDALSSTKGIRVRPRASVLPLKGTERDPRDVGRELGVQVIVEGNVRRVGETLRVAARLVSVIDGFQLWVRRFERNVGDLLGVTDEAANAIAESLTVVRLAPARQAPTDSTAIDLYLRARHEYHKGRPVNVSRAAGLFEEALKRAPADRRILGGYALAQMRRLSVEDSSEALAHVALRAATRAQQGATSGGEARVAMAHYHFIMGDAVSAAREANDALRLAPALAEVQDLCGRLLVEVGRPEEGLAFFESALSLEPSMFRVRLDQARISGLMGDWSVAEALYALRVPDDDAERIALWASRARMASWRRDPAWAQEVSSDVAALPASPLRTIIEGTCALVMKGTLPPELVAAAESLGKVTGRVRRRPAFYRQLKAEAHAYVGDDAAALLDLEEAVGLGLTDVVWLDRCPLFESLRGKERFRALRANVQVRAEQVLLVFT